jgi:5-oxoprolinase (ATP-hydrolysing) subunit A
MPIVDLNVNLGEMPEEPRELYALATVVNIACGGHAGDKASMARALSFAMARGAKVAAHPSYPDRQGFGRVRIAISLEELAQRVEEQCAALQAIAQRIGYPVTIVKPHGALYHDAGADPAVAGALLHGALRGLDSPGSKELTVVGPPEGSLLAEAHARGLRYAREGFADRAYPAGGGLVARSEPGALITDLGAATRQAIALASSGRIETLCVHSDTQGAVAIARAVRDALIQNGYLLGST